MAPKRSKESRSTKKATPSPQRRLRALERWKAEFGPAAAAQKRALLGELERARLQRAKDVLALHETLCFLRAYPDDEETLAVVERLLRTFAGRRDLVAHADELVNSGVAGTEIVYPFYAEMARWLASRWPDRLHVVWDEEPDRPRLERLLPHLVLPAEAACMEELAMSVEDWCARLAPNETDAAFLVRRIERLGLSPSMHELLYQELGLVLRLAADADLERDGGPTPSRTLARAEGIPVHFQSGPMRRARPDLALEAERPPLAIREVSEEEGARWIDLAREAMVTRSRDLDAFSYGDPRDVRVVEHEDGLAFVAVGVRPERRLLLEAVYAFLTLKNGVPIGYVLNSALYGSAEIAYNVFETFRGGEAAHVYGRVVATVRALFGCDSFTIYPYQLGDENEEALSSGAWWFYQKLGFRPKDRATRKLMEQELRRMKREPGHRTSIDTLRELARENVYLHLGAERDDVVGLVTFGDVGMAVLDHVARRSGADRDRVADELDREAAALVGGVDFDGWSAEERASWRSWAPLIVTLPGTASWTKEERAALVDVARAKGGRRESDFVRTFDRHAPLRAAILGLIEGVEL